MRKRDIDVNEYENIVQNVKCEKIANVWKSTMMYEKQTHFLLSFLYLKLAILGIKIGFWGMSITKRATFRYF